MPDDASRPRTPPDAVAPAVPDEAARRSARLAEGYADMAVPSFRDFADARSRALAALRGSAARGAAR